ncbi:23S rRNA (pseudouridine(1915)-N(3))-methyltransferase RlmH [Pelovirga terrestris]|uniref:Ribosomal RNA large subunit methyltransferase H n=1 Tax=Pelovirga terrestris TaxID=2771352 RepID=A0A8J6UIL2_9BACT|nr:23S rRNA (pseudouridine(1915)-N(3))-methyltransferase RlmH [Pelovirga terrestris]
MKLRLICVGKLNAWQRAAAADYSERLQHYLGFELVELKEEKGGRKDSPAVLLKREGERILARVGSTEQVVVLDEGGRQFDSEGLAALLEAAMLHAGRDWCLIIGGACGIDPEVRKRADLCLSLSKMTFTHQMARIFLLEQLYRSVTIIRHEPYHNP